MRGTTREVIAANIRARLAWAGMGAKDIQQVMAWTSRTTYNKLHGVTPLTPEEIDRIADELGTDPGALFHVPEGFSSPFVSSDSAIAA